MKRRNLGLWLVVGWIGFAVLPWNAIGGQGFLAFRWLAGYPLGLREAPAAIQLLAHGRLWFVPFALVLALSTFAFVGRCSGRMTSRLLIGSGAIGLLATLAIALAIDITGWTWRPLAALFGCLPGRQPGLGYGALAVAAASLMVPKPPSANWSRVT